MMVPRPYEANLGPKNEVFDFSKLAKIFLVENVFRPGQDRITAGRRSETGGWRGGPGEGQGGANKSHPDPKITEKITNNCFSDWSAAQAIDGPSVRAMNYQWS